MPALRISSKKAVRHMPATYIIIDHPHFNSLRSLFYQYVSDQTSNSIILKDIIFHMDMLLRFL